MARPTRLFFVADIHGSERCFKKFVNAGPVYKADVLLIGGDIAAKTITPLFPQDGGWVAEYMGVPRRARSPEEVARLEADLRAMGTLPHRTTRTEWAELQADRGRADALFRDLAVESLEGWVAFATTRLKGTGVRTLIGLGNDDIDEMEPVLAASDYVELTDDRILRLDDHHEVLTLAYSNPTPWRTSRELPEEEIAKRLAELGARLEAPERAVLNAHVPPVATPLDLAPKLDANLTKVMTPGGEPDMIHVGSTAVRATLERSRYLLGLHGHIHESKGFTVVGPTLCVNPGSVYSEGVLQGAVVDLEPKRVRSYVLTTG